MEKQVSLKDIAIINAFPVLNFRTVLNVGCGDCELDHVLKSMGPSLYSTDIIKSDKVDDTLKFSIADIFDYESFPIVDDNRPRFDVVICSQVLEHLEDWEKALFNLLLLADKRLIITIPYRKSFLDPGHVNFWDDDEVQEFIDVIKFEDLCAPYSVAISKIITKLDDVKTGQRCYLIIIDKTQIG